MIHPARILAIVALAVCPSLSASGATGPSASQTAPARIDLSVSPVADLHFYVRSLVLSSGEIPHEYVEVVRQARTYEAAVQGPRGWGFIEPLLTRCRGAGDLEQWTQRLPERFRLISGTVIEPRKISRPYAVALAGAEAAFLRNVWPVHEPEIERARRDLESLLADREEQLLAYVVERLAMKVGPSPVPVFLVAEAPPPGASTSASRRLGTVSFVGVSGLSGPGLVEVVLHEVIHALDLRTREQPTALNRVRRMLRDAGMKPEEPLLREVPHAIVFVQAAEAVRRLIDPKHAAHGPAHAFRTDAREMGELVLSRWRAYLEGALGLDETLEAIVGSVRPPEEPSR